jgi:hypothetical protein
MVDTALFIVISLIIMTGFTYRNYAVSRRDAYLLRAGLLFTLAADVCLLLIHDITFGLLFFICVQTIYIIRYLSARRIAFVSIPVLLCLFFLLSLTPLNLMYRLAIVYACALSTSTLLAFLNRKVYPYPNRILVPLGMLLFLLCDINVALFNELPSSTGRSVAWVLIWIFYLPSQLCLALSGAKFKGGFLNERK